MRNVCAGYFYNLHECFELFTMYTVRCWFRCKHCMYNYTRHSMLLVSYRTILSDTASGTERNVCRL